MSVEACGKAGNELLKLLLKHTGAGRRDVLIGPSAGYDFSVISAGDTVIVVSTDPLYLDERLGIERSAKLSFQFVAADVAVSGINPTHMAVAWNLPPAFEEKKIIAASGIISREARLHGITIVAGHTGFYEGACLPYAGAATCIGIGKKISLKLPSRARNGDDVVLAGIPALEAALFMCSMNPKSARKAIGNAGIARIQRYWEEQDILYTISLLREGAVCMHDAGERGIAQALNELSDATSKQIALNEWPSTVGEVRKLCIAARMDEISASSTGVVLAVVRKNAQRICEILRKKGIRAVRIGSINSGSGVLLPDGSRLQYPEKDGMSEALKG